MRIAAGILTLIGGLIGGSLFIGILHGLGAYGVLLYIPLIIATIGGIMALKRMHYGWALAGAICSLLFPLCGIPAIILLVKRKGEFVSRETAIQGYECTNLQFANGRCTCAHGKKLSMAIDGSISAKSILRGTIPAACKVCELFSQNECPKGEMDKDSLTRFQG